MVITDIKAIDVVTFGFEGTRVRCVVCSSIDYQMSLIIVNIVAKWSKFVMYIFEWDASIHLEYTDINVKQT